MHSKSVDSLSLTRAGFIEYFLVATKLVHALTAIAPALFLLYYPGLVPVELRSNMLGLLLFFGALTVIMFQALDVYSDDIFSNRLRFRIMFFAWASAFCLLLFMYQGLGLFPYLSSKLVIFWFTGSLLLFGVQRLLVLRLYRAWMKRGMYLQRTVILGFTESGRRWASQQVEADALIYLTQDAIPASPDSFANLLDELYAEADIGVAYGRQLPHPGAGLLGAQARRFNYPPESRSKRLADASELGIKTCFSSDSFSAYRSDALAAVGGFPEDVIGSEDAYVAARLLQAGYAVRYAASAEVYHSHDYRLLEEFRRYFDIGVFYGRERWIRAAFGGAGGEGKRYVLAEIQALRAAGALYRVPEIALRSAFKLLGYRLGQLERHLPVALKRRISMFPGYWK